MREPQIGRWDENGEAVDYLPFSQAPSERLAARIAIGGRNMSGDQKDYDDDFRRRYAAILLRERGL